MSEKKPRITWRKPDTVAPMLGYFGKVPGGDWSVSGKRTICVRDSGSRGWYWYGIGRNTLNEPGLRFLGLEAAKAHAKDALQTHLKSQDAVTTLAKLDGGGAEF